MHGFKPRSERRALGNGRYFSSLLGPAATKITRQIKNLSRKPCTTISEEETPADLTEGDIKAMMQSWMGSRPAFLNSQVIRFSYVDKELKLPAGSAKKYIVDIARRWEYVPEQQGEKTVLFTQAARKLW